MIVSTIFAISFRTLNQKFSISNLQYTSINDLDGKFKVA